MTYLPGFCHGRRALARTIGQHAYDVWVIRHLIDHCPSPRPIPSIRDSPVATSEQPITTLGVNW